MRQKIKDRVRIAKYDLIGFLGFLALVFITVVLSRRPEDDTEEES